jgi:hypothetical protein
MDYVKPRARRVKRKQQPRPKAKLPAIWNAGQVGMAILVEGKEPAFLRQILELVADQFCESQRRQGRHVDNSSARLAALRDGCWSFPTLDWTADIWEVAGHA